MKYLFLAILFISISTEYTLGQDWKTYPYTPEGSIVSFPADEGRHPAEPIEWWYTVGHVVGQNTGTHYTYMLTYFYNESQPPFQGFRILNFSNDDTGEFFSDTQPLTYAIMAEDSFNILANVGFNVFSPTKEHWKVKVDGSGKSLPFEYEMEAASANGSLKLEYDAVKPPLILGGDGKFDQGISNYTYYYSQTMNTVSGELSFNGVSEPVTGTSWIDRQYGTFNPYTGEVYEWFCLQLSNGMDINVWSLFTIDDILPEDDKYKHISVYVDENTHYTTTDFNLERLKYVFTEDGERCYSQKWRLTSAINNLDVTMETLHSGTEVTLPFRFYEGAMKIEGSVNGVDVSGKGFAELLHSYEHPVLEMNVVEDAVLDSFTPISWKVSNPDDGRPILYDLFYSIDDKGSFEKIATGIQNTFFVWKDLSLEDKAKCWIRVDAYSVDTTLVGETISEKAYTVSNVATGVNAKMTVSEKVIVYPNPANGSLSLRASGARILAYEIYDISGKSAQSEEVIPSNSLRLNVNGLSQGVYLISIKSDKGIQRSRFVIRR